MSRVLPERPYLQLLVDNAFFACFAAAFIFLSALGILVCLMIPALFFSGTDCLAWLADFGRQYPDWPRTAGGIFGLLYGLAFLVGGALALEDRGKELEQ